MEQYLFHVEVGEDKHSEVWHLDVSAYLAEVSQTARHYPLVAARSQLSQVIPTPLFSFQLIS